jgi:hypothetical protein
MWRRALSHPLALPACVLLALLLVLPTVRTGLIGDDFLFRELITGAAHHAHPGAFFGLYTFADGQLDHVQHMKDVGLYQWWVSDGALMSFWRPLSELTHWLDYLLWPTSTSLMHVHSLAWYALLVWLLGRHYQQLDPSPARASMATLLFAVGAMHIFTVIWLAARNQLIAGCFLLLTLNAHHRWRQSHRWRDALAACGALILGLLSAEAAVATLGYLLAYTLTLDNQAVRWRRWASLLPYILILLVWRAVYHELGYGSHGSGGYIDPGSDPLRFAQAVVLRLPALLIASLYGVSSTVFHFLPDRSQMLYAGAAGLAALGTFWLMRSYGVWRSPIARYHALGALLALVPVCAASTNDRLLLNAEFGLCGLLAWLFDAFLARRAPEVLHQPRSRLIQVAAVSLMVIHLLLYPAAKAALSFTTPAMIDMAAKLEPLSLPDARATPGSRVILVNPPKALFVGYYPAIRRYHGMVNAASMQALTSGDQVVTLTTLGEREIEVRGSIGLGEFVSRDFRVQPFHQGERMQAGHFIVTVEEVAPNGNARSARFEFDSPLNRAPWQLYAWGASGYERFQLPPVGQSVVLPSVNVSKIVKKKLGALL